MEVKLYVCPTPECGNYFGHNGMPDLSIQHTGPKTEDRHQVSEAGSRVGVAGKRHNRAECPDCRLRGVYVQRELISIAFDPESLRRAPA